MPNVLLQKAERPTETPHDTGRDAAFGWKTVLFNDEWHTFQDVALQLMKAIRCTRERGFALANVVHHTGSAIVYQGPKERCEAVAMVLEDIKLKTQVCQ